MPTLLFPAMKGIQRIGQDGYLKPSAGEYDAFTADKRPLGHFVTLTEAAAAVHLAAARRRLGAGVMVFLEDAGNIRHTVAGIIAKADDCESAERALIAAGWTLTKRGPFCDTFTA